MNQSKFVKISDVDLTVVSNSLRTAIATLVSFFVARTLKMPEFYWAPISTIVIMQSTINPVQGAWQRFVGTALGAILGAVFATFVGRTVAIYALGIFLCGILAAMLRAWSAYRVTAITFSIVVLISRGPGWSFALHRFIEVSIGIAVALVAMLIWKGK
ncbi:MAG TPA: FUSC family protein [Terriglobales bacterium]|nr:FUSC family protein [Terriglobales bacterium]